MSVTVLLAIACAVLLLALLATAVVAAWAIQLAGALYETIEREVEDTTGA